MRQPGAQAVVRRVVGPRDPRWLIDLLAQQSNLSHAVLQDAMNKGAVWLTRRGAGRHRVRRAGTMLDGGELVELHFDERVLAQVLPRASCLRRASRYSVWRKPPGLLAQGSDSGDHCSLLRRRSRSIPATTSTWSTGWTARPRA